MKTVKRYRLMFVSDNTLNTLWTLRLSRGRAWLLGLCSLSAVAALLFVLFWLTPLGQILPGYMKPSQRRSSVENLSRADSLLNVQRQQQLWTDNLLVIMQGGDTAAVADVKVEAVGDTLLAASERERRFVDEWTRRERFNLQVVAPVKASSMSFRPPLAVIERADSLDVGALRLWGAPGGIAVAPASGVVVAVRYDVASALATVIVQHEQGFLSRIDGLADVAVADGDMLSGGQVLGRMPHDAPSVELRMWRDGMAVDPRITADFGVVNKL